MCGIAGFSGKGTIADLERMVDTIRYRGPDDEGKYFERGIGLGFRRLAILDLTPSGHQPMWNASNSVGIVFNGEIYNYRELKKQLVSNGYKFRSTSDTEVIIALYEQYGEACFEKLSGMFGIALYDKRAKKLLLARDRMGKKPLYYGHIGDTLVFGSEPKTLLCHPSVTRALDHTALDAYLALDYVPTPMSIYKGIKKLEPGAYLVFNQGNVSIKKFWNPAWDELPIPLEEATRIFEEKFVAAIDGRLVSDVPLGIFLSGGLDSSSVAYYAARLKGEPIHTFSIGFEEKSFDESIYAKEVAAHVKSIHHHKMLSGEDSLAALPQVFFLLDEPMADASIIPTYILSRYTKEYVTVALGGDGGDELLAGYPTFQAERMYSMLQHFPHAIREGLPRKLHEKLPASYSNLSLKFKLEKYLDGIGEKDIVDRHMRWLGTFNKSDRSQLYTKATREHLKENDPYSEAKRYFEESQSHDEHNRLLYAYQRSYMMDQVMVKVDRASMFASLEARAPFLDYELVEFVNRLPYNMKLHGMTGKYLLKKLMEGKLPNHIIHRKKKGFGIPVAAWLRGPLKGWAEALLFDENPMRNELFSSVYIRDLWDEHQSGARDHRKKLWNLLTLLEWGKRY